MLALHTPSRRQDLISAIKPYVTRQKNDMADAEAIAEANMRPNMRFVATKGPDDQSAMILHKVRLMLNRQVVILGNAIRAHMAYHRTGRSPPRRPAACGNR
jgi:transposase